MKCPLFVSNDPVRLVDPAKAVGDCLQEECAWWSNEDKHCAIHLIGASIDNLVGQVEGIRNANV